MDSVNCKCTICDNFSDLGIHIVSSFICKQCEQEMVKTDVRDERYPFFVSRMKHVLLESKANA